MKCILLLIRLTADVKKKFRVIWKSFKYSSQWIEKDIINSILKECKLN